MAVDDTQITLMERNIGLLHR